jgi:hypothetical protein
VSVAEEAVGDVWGRLVEVGRGGLGGLQQGVEDVNDDVALMHGEAADAEQAQQALVPEPACDMHVDDGHRLVEAAHGHEVGVAGAVAD